MTPIISPLRYWLSGIAIAWTLAISGCATIGLPEPDLPDDVALERTDREEKVAEDFKRTRDGALYKAAVARWRDGDVAACESLLMRLLERSKDHREARLMLADLYGSTGKPTAAERHLRLLVDRTADDAQAHHSLGMLLAANSKTDEALQYLQTAAELEPDNELYAASYETAQADSNALSEQTQSPPQRKTEAATIEAGIDG